MSDSSAVVKSILSGRRLARAIHQHFTEETISSIEHLTCDADDVLNVTSLARVVASERQSPPFVDVEGNSKTAWIFPKVLPGLDEEAARAEAARCFQCSTLCDKCVEVCPNRANYTYFAEPVRLRVPVLACSDDVLAVTGDQHFEILQARQVLHVDDFCNECGNCATFCVHQGKPYADKPRLFLDEADFRQETDNAFHIAGDTIRRREGGRESTLTLTTNGMVYEDAHARVDLTPEFEVRSAELKEVFEGEVSLASAAEMAMMLRGVAGSRPFVAALP